MSVYYADYHHHQTAGMSGRAPGESWIANAAASRAPVDASPILTPLNELTPSSGHHQNSQHFPQSNLDSTFPFFMPHQFYPHHTSDSYPAPSGEVIQLLQSRVVNRIICRSTRRRRHPVLLDALRPVQTKRSQFLIPHLQGNRLSQTGP